jgi:hypothetical protein
MEPTSNDQTGKENILAKIREKHVSMRPKLHFTLQTILTFVVATIVLVLSVAIANFILFGLRINGHESLLAFGPRGLFAFLLVFPWPLLALDILFIFILEKLLRRFKFGYRSPVLYLLIVLIAGALALGLALDRGTSFNDDLLRHADRGELPPPFGDVYEGVRVPAPHGKGIYRGVILEIATSSFQLMHDDRDHDVDDDVYTVILPSDAPVSSLMTGDRVYVAGDREGSVIHAFGVHMLPPHGEIPPPPLP